MNRERVQMLRDMMAGVPEERVNLNSFYRANGNPCNTIACIAGWAAIYPPFVKKGFGKGEDGLPEYKGHRGMYAAAEFFDVDPSTFGLTGYSNHKATALRRLDKLLDE